MMIVGPTSNSFLGLVLIKTKKLKHWVCMSLGIISWEVVLELLLIAIVEIEHCKIFILDLQVFFWLNNQCAKTKFNINQATRQLNKTGNQILNNKSANKLELLQFRKEKYKIAQLTATKIYWEAWNWQTRKFWLLFLHQMSTFALAFYYVLNRFDFLK